MNERLGATQLLLLQALREVGCITVPDLAILTGVADANVHRSLVRMSKRGIVKCSRVLRPHTWMITIVGMKAYRVEILRGRVPGVTARDAGLRHWPGAPEWITDDVLIDRHSDTD